jgi:hypothetical protein
MGRVVLTSVFLFGLFLTVAKCNIIVTEVMFNTRVSNAYEYIGTLQFLCSQFYARLELHNTDTTNSVDISDWKIAAGLYSCLFASVTGL